ncbi:hypothetical protein KI387_041909, partial [Taxus chinensis]
VAVNVDEKEIGEGMCEMEELLVRMIFEHNVLEVEHMALRLSLAHVQIGSLTREKDFLSNIIEIARTTSDILETVIAEKNSVLENLTVENDELHNTILALRGEKLELENKCVSLQNSNVYTKALYDCRGDIVKALNV